MSTCASSSSKHCFNTECKELKPERPKKAWRLRMGDFAELCDRCFSAYESGRFCDTFHKNAPGWRPCESCGKGVHCGCIVSHQLQLFSVLDPGGIECSTCARKNVFLTSNPAWSPSLFFHSPVPERLKDLSAKNWSQLAGSGPVPWRAAPGYFSSSVTTPEMGPRLPYEVVDVSCALNNLNSTPEKKSRNVEELSERLQNGGHKLINDSSAKTGGEPMSSCISVPCVKEDLSSPQFGLSTPYISTNETNSQNGLSGSSLLPTPPSFPKQFSANSYSGVDSCETQIRNARPRADARGKTQLLPRYWPRFTDQELQQMSGELSSNSVITPLFEKMLSASDAGRIGRLVLPKKCAEAYFPPISQPEGLPLKVQDARGKEWIFQFRFWPNNNSRMYVLEGVTPCIQSMQLQAGDIVTFSRMEPEGKLVMGFRKASAAPPSDQENEISKNSNGVPTRGDAELADPSCWSKVDKSGYIAKEAVGVKAIVHRKRKSSTLGSKSKRLRIENDDLMELKVTWQQAQGLLRPPANHLPSIVVIEGFEFEEYEDAPVVGKPTIFVTNNAGDTIQWIQCEDCFKFRKLPADALLSSKFKCSNNTWDPERAFCLAAPELTMEELEELIHRSLSAGSKKMKSAKQESEMENLDTLANLAILGEQATTTKHPRHRPGCSCIVCIQPPSGKGPKHKQTCTCSVCVTVKRRFRTLMERREKKQSEKYAETTRNKPAQDPSSELSPEKVPAHEASDEEPSKAKSLSSPFKGRIDLNIQPEREEELSPMSDSGGMLKLHDATERYLKQRENPVPLVEEVSNGEESPAMLTVKSPVPSTAVG